MIKLYDPYAKRQDVLITESKARALGGGGGVGFALTRFSKITFTVDYNSTSSQGPSRTRLALDYDPANAKPYKGPQDGAAKVEPIKTFKKVFFLVVTVSSFFLYSLVRLFSLYL